MILGTAAYMAPEQARGKAVDKRADIWAFGVVVFEMLTGRRLFEGETLSDTLAAVLTKEVDWSRLPAATPSSIRQLLRRCLERDPTRRLRDIGEARRPARPTPPERRRTAGVHRRSAGVGPKWRSLAAAARGRHRRAACVLSGRGLRRAARRRPSRSRHPGEHCPRPREPTCGVDLARRRRSSSSPRREGSPRLFVKRSDEPAARDDRGTEGATGPVHLARRPRMAFIASAACGWSAWTAARSPSDGRQRRAGHRLARRRASDRFRTARRRR